MQVCTQTLVLKNIKEDSRVKFGKHFMTEWCMIHDSLVIILETPWDYGIIYFLQFIFSTIQFSFIWMLNLLCLGRCDLFLSAVIKKSMMKKPAVAQAEKLLLHLPPQIPHQTHMLDKITSAPLNNHGQDIKYLQCLIFVFGCACVQSPAWIFVTWHRYKYRKSPNLRNCSPFHLGNLKSVWI